MVLLACVLSATGMLITGLQGMSPAATTFACSGSLVPPAIGIAPTNDGLGYWIADSRGDVESCGDASNVGGLPSGSASPVVAISADPSVSGFWLTSATGQVFTFGYASSYGDASNVPLTKGIVAMEPTPDGKGYWLLGGDGGVFAYGDAQFFGSTGNIHLNRPAVGMVASSDGKGYWFVASDGGIFSYGDTVFYGSMGGTPLNQPVVGMTPSADGKGYRMVASDGGIFSFGDAGFFGSSSGKSFFPIAGMAASPDGQGYWVVDTSGDVYSFGDAGGGSPTSSTVANTSSSTSPSTTGTSTTTSTPTTTSSTSTTIVVSSPTNPAAIPIGDGNVSTSPEIGYVDSCSTTFGGGGAKADGPWMDLSTNTWNSLTKIAVEGSVSWPTASYSVTTSGTSRLIATNDLPQGHTTGIFPISSSDPAFQYDSNPNSIKAQSVNWSLPLNPIAAASPKCVGLGAIGVLNDGILLFNALDAEGRDAGAHEVLDSCAEHPESTGELHHHFVPSCIMDSATGSSTLVGYAADGYGIYVERDANGNLLTNAQLDVCHGRTSQVMWNGSEQNIYHYDATIEYPYTVGCFHGTPVNPT